MNVVARVLTGDSDRPAALAALFWLDLVAVTVVAVVNVGPRRPDLLVPLGINVAAVLVLWRYLPWSGFPADPPGLGSAGRGRRGAVHRLVPTGFFFATLAFGFTGSAALHTVMILVAIAAIGFAHGLRIGWTLAGLFTAALLVAQLVLTPDRVGFAVNQAIIAATGSAFVLALTSAAVEARRRRAEAERLLDTVRELAIGEERARMARDMHDSVGHHLTVLKIGLENAERFREHRPADAWAEVRQAKELASQTLAETRQWVRALRPLDLDGVSGVAALEQLARSFDGVRFVVEFTVVGPGGGAPGAGTVGHDSGTGDVARSRFDPRTELVLYRVLQEGLTNALRHSGAATVRVGLEIGADEAVLTIADDGCGWGGEPGFGLTALDDRVREIGGRLTFPDVPTGVTIRTSVPVREIVTARGSGADRGSWSSWRRARQDSRATPTSSVGGVVR